MPYKINPKMDRSGILAAIPQTGTCPNKCGHCFFQSGRSYLEPLETGLPNMPPVEMAKGRVVRMNDGNDSNVNRQLVIESSKQYDNVFFNTGIPKNLGEFPGPVVLTVNPAHRTEKDPYLLETIPDNLMFVRVRTTTWNQDVVKKVVDHYTPYKVPVVLTFMAYFSGEDAPEEIPEEYLDDYVCRKRTQNVYWAITHDAWKRVMSLYEKNPFVYSCGREGVSSCCERCGNCMREYWNTVERIRTERGETA